MEITQEGSSGQVIMVVLVVLQAKGRSATASLPAMSFGRTRNTSVAQAFHAPFVMDASRSLHSPTAATAPS